jgi:hypothetical protein
MKYTEELIVTHCWCGVALAIPSNLHRIANDEGKSVYCPLGHTFVFGNSYKEQLDKAQSKLRATKDLLAAEERSHSATRGQITKLKKRIGNGVCPCCKRHFANVEAHMKNKHPEVIDATA